MNLSQADVLFLDCQTTGAAPPKARVIELGWCFSRGCNDSRPTQSSLIALPADCEIPNSITRITGITREDLAEAPSEDDAWGLVWQSAAHSVKRDVPRIIHYARFERTFLQSQIEQTEDVFCTYEIARRIYPDLPSRSLRAVSGFLGHGHSSLKRSADHVDATRIIWKHICAKLETEFGIFSFDDLRHFLNEAPPKAAKKSYQILAATRLALPASPGIYRFLNAKSDLLYVGKAKSLRSRVNSYFRGQKTKGFRLNELLSQVTEIHYTETSSALEAAIVENDSIKNGNPPYNRALKVERRQIGFCSERLKPMTAAASKCWGPFPSLSFVERVCAFFEAVETDSVPTVEFEDISDELMREAIAYYRQTILGTAEPNWRRNLVRAWGASIKKERMTRNQPPEELEEEVESPEGELSAEDIASHIARCFAAFARRVHRARWLRRLLQCDVLYEEAGKSRVAHVRRGIVTFSSGKEHKREELDALENIDGIFDVAVYDRMQVLFAEMRRLLKGGNSLQLVLPEGRVIQARQLRKFMFPSDFDEED
ncbi:MAG: exonuclease domain-containing protein [Oligoflexales bacterium]